MTSPTFPIRYLPNTASAKPRGIHAAQRQELERVLAAGLFDRAPSLAQVLTYVCEKHFEGTSQDLKEYNIAVDALGRSVDFDQKKDSIVRVQMFRLRDRLAEYYAHSGEANALMIEIPQGQYAPRFVEREQAMGEAPSVIALSPALAHSVIELSVFDRPIPAAPLAEPAPPPPVERPRKWKPWVVAIATLGVLAALASALAVSEPVEGKAAAPMLAALPSDSVRILVGQNEGTLLDGFGRTWQADRFFEGGEIVKVPERAIRGTRDPKLYQNRRQGMFSYHIPLNAGTYELRLHFAEVHFGEDNLAGFGGEGSRAFGIEINGQLALTRLDILGEAGSSTAHVRVFKDVSPAADGKLHLTFPPRVSVPLLNAIEVTPGTLGKLQPIRIVMQDRPYTDPKGRTWVPDRYAMGGQLVKRPPLAGAPDPTLFAGERFGNLTYNIPAPPGKYSVTFYMAERWLGPGMPGGGRGGVGSRLFDVLANGVFLARNVDVLKLAGGPDKPLIQTFRGLEPNHQGYLSFSLVPYKNFPIISAIEVLDEAR